MMDRSSAPLFFPVEMLVSVEARFMDNFRSGAAFVPRRDEQFTLSILPR
jgi:hypothetical protein